MNLRELIELIPYYVAKTLNDEQRSIIERELPNSPELQKELAFWERARHSLIATTKYTEAGHPDVANLINYLEGANDGDIKEKQRIEQHLSQCSNCREEISVLQRTYHPSLATRMIGVMNNILNKAGDFLISYLRPPRLVYTVPAAVVITVCVIVAINLMKTPHEIFELKSGVVSRGATEWMDETIPTLTLTGSKTDVDISVTTQPSGIDSTTYMISLESPAGVTSYPAPSLSPALVTDTTAIVRFTIPSSSLRTGGRYTVCLRESYPASARATPSLPRYYSFKLVLSGQ